MLGFGHRSDLDRFEAFAREIRSPAATDELGEPGQVVLLDEEVRAGPSTLSSTRRTTHQGGDTGLEAAIAQRLHLGDRAGHRRDHGNVLEDLLRNADRKRLHPEKLRQSFGGSKPETVDHETEGTVKHLKLGVIICGALGIAGLLLVGIGTLLELQQTDTILLLIAFALPVVMGAIALARPPMRPWQAGVSLSGFALAAWKLEIWTMLRSIADQPNSQRLIVVGATLGVIVAIVAIMRPEEIA
jgi:hypothetical protein